MGTSQWYHADLQRVKRNEWLGFIGELESFFHGTDRKSAQEDARRIITETTGVSDPKIVWNEC